MKYTGIRAVPYATPHRIMQPHVARYEFSNQVIEQATNVLDVACGTGYGASILKSKGYKKVFGVDLDWSAVVYANGNYGEADGINFLQANGSNLPLDENSIDLITCFETFEHILDSHDFLIELCRVLKPTGVLIISVPNAPIWAPFSTPPDLAVDDIRSGLGHKHNFSAKEFFQLLTQHFYSVSQYGQDFRRISYMSKLGRQLERIKIYLEYRLARYHVAQLALGGSLADVLPQDDLNVTDIQWRVKEWDNQNYEPIFCIAVCRRKSVS